MTFHQDVIAVIWDFDKTLIPTYMQKPLFQAYGVEEKTFWKEVDTLVDLYRREGLSVNPETLYLNHILTYIQAGRFPGLNNAKLRELGKELVFFPGIPELFQEFQKLTQEEGYKKFDIKIENYVVSTGLSQMIHGSSVKPHIQNIWGCEFIEVPYGPGKDGNLEKLPESEGVLSSIAYTIDNTTKTRALFEINKGVNKFPETLSVNQRMPEEDRRVPFMNMLYIADGPSDIPAFSVVKRNGGRTLAVYDKDDPKSFRQAKSLHEDERVDYFAEADYRPGNTTRWILDVVQSMADRIVEVKKKKMEAGKASLPQHLN